jgi:hypothetical protein
MVNAFYIHQDLKREPTTVELTDFARKISPWWEEFACALEPCGMTEADVRDISATCCESEGNRSKAITMLNMWHDQHGSEGTVRRLCATSLKVERRAAAEGVFGKDIVDVVNREIASESKCLNYVVHADQ